MKLIPKSILNNFENRPNLLTIIDNINWLILDKIFRTSLGIFISVSIARYLGPEEFGKLNFSTALIGVFGAISGLGVEGILVRDFIKAPHNKYETIGSASVLLLISGILSYFLINILIYYLREDSQIIQLLIAIMGTTLMLKVSDVALYWFESQVQSKYLVLFQNIVFIVFSIIKIVLIYNKTTLTIFAWVNLVEAIFTALIIGLVMEMKGLKIKKYKFSFIRTKSILKESWPLLLSSMSIMIYMKTDQLILGRMMGDKFVGIYSAAVRVSEGWYFIPIAIIASIFPTIIKTKNRDRKLYLKYTQQLFDLMVWISLGASILITILSQKIILLLYGESYISSSYVLMIHIWASAFVFFGVVTSKWLLAENLQYIQLQRTIIGAFLNILFNILFIPFFGLIGSAIATFISQFVVGFLLDYFHIKTREIFEMKMKSINPIRVFLLIKIYFNK
jgi:O-antigen/teichoic acid export membrane protein